ncbi:hypothetical protein KC19_4G037100 [Ceratodon purpureus]|uniref:Uncharacterized protein n=1 Tax=Ceratodon purpureus TaxID=3225 RepID=A0A8T0I802_CERPU|nr:hypothetical protein KC19_4G037100 [Ceratodon purpureus]
MSIAASNLMIVNSGRKKRCNGSVTEWKCHHYTHQQISRGPDQAMENNLSPWKAISSHGSHAFDIPQGPIRGLCDNNHICVNTHSKHQIFLYNASLFGSHVLQNFFIYRGRLGTPALSLCFNYVTALYPFELLQATGHTNWNAL